MKILHIFGSLKFSGAEVMYVDASNCFQEYGCELSVIATQPELGEYADNFREAGYNVTHYPCPRGFFNKINYIFKLKKLFHEEKIDLVHIHVNSLYFPVALASWLAGKQSIYTFHNVFPTKNWTRPIHIAKRWVSKNIFNCKFQTISDSVYNNELQTFRNDTKKIDNWYGGDRYYPATNFEEKNKIRSEIEISENSFVIISIGGCSHIKRHEEIINAMSLIIKDIPNLIYLHLGTGESEVAEIELAEKLKLTNNIRFVGNQKNVRKYLVASDLYIMPSKFEGISLTTIEAMTCNIPTILYDVPGLKDFNKHGSNSILIEPDHEVLANTILNVFQGQIDITKYVKSAKQFVDKKYDMRTNTTKIFNVYLGK